MAVDGITATYIVANQFSVTGNQTADFHAGRRCKAELTGGDVYSTISGSVFGAVTTVTLFDSELDNTLTKVWYGIGLGSEGSLPDHTHDGTEGSGGELTISGSGVTDHSGLNELDFASSGHTGFLAQAGSTPLTGDWDFGSQTISGTGDIWCNDLHTSAGSLYVGNYQFKQIFTSTLSGTGSIRVFGSLTAEYTSGDNAGFLQLIDSANSTRWQIANRAADSNNLQIYYHDGISTWYGPWLAMEGDTGYTNLGSSDFSGSVWRLNIFQDTAGEGVLRLSKAEDGAGGAAFSGYKSRGIHDAPTAVQASDVVAGYNASAYDGSTFDTVGRLRHMVESISSGNVKSYIEFHVSDSSGVLQEMARINSTGLIVGDGVNQQADYALHVKDAWAILSLDGSGSTSISEILFDKQGNTQWLMYNDGANADTFIIESNGVNMYSIAIGRTYGDIGIGYKGPNLPNSTTRLSIIADESTGAGLLNLSQYSNDSSGSAFNGYSARGADQSNPTAVQAGDVITGYNAQAHDGTVFDLVGRNRHKVESINLGDIASYWELHTSDISGTMREVVRVHSTGDLELYEGALILANYGSIGVPGRIDIITVSSGTTNIVEFDSHIRATLSGTYDIGTSDYPFRDIYLTGGSVYLNNEKISSPSAGVIDFNNATITNATISGGGVTDHSLLSNLDYASADHTGFVSIATDQTITGAKTFTQDVTISGSLTATASGTFGYLEVTDSISEIQFTSASGIIGVAGDSDLIQLEPEQVTIVGTANSRMIFQTVSGTIGVYNNEDMITFTAGGTLGSHSADLYFDNQTTVEFGYKAYFDHAVVVSGTIGIPGDESLLDLSNNQLTVGGLSATIEFGTSSGTIGVSDNTDLMELTTTAVVFDGHIRATVSGAYDIGEIDLPFRDIYLTGGSIYLDGSSISLDAWGNFDFGDKQIITTGPLQMGNTVETNPGLMRWTGTDFEGYKGSEWVSLTASGSGGSSTFTGLTDTPADYTGHAGKSAVVKGDETGLEFVTVSGGGGGGDLLADGTVPMTANWPFGNYSLFIGDNANANMTIGLTINQGANDDEILAFKSSDVNQPFTTYVEADTYYSIQKLSATAGGAKIRALSDGDARAFKLEAFMGTTDPTDTTPAIQFAGYKSDGGTDVAALASSETVFQIQNLSTNLLTILGSGETLQTGPLGIGSQASVASNSPLLLVYSASASARINLEGTSSGADGAIGFYKTGEDAFAGIYGENTGVGAGDLRFATDDGATHSEKMRITGGGLIGINESSNTDMTIGLTINQGANNDEIIGVKRTGHNHSFTDLAETDTYGTLGVFDDSVGGIKWRGYSTGNRAATIQAFTTTQDTTKSTAGLGCIEFNAFGQTAATYGNLSDAANIVVIRGYSGGASLTKWICDENGETWQSGGATFGGDIYCVDVIPTVSGSGNVGSAQKPWAQVYLADQATGDVYGVTIVSGTITTTLV